MTGAKQSVGTTHRRSSEVRSTTKTIVSGVRLNEKLSMADDFGRRAAHALLERPLSTLLLLAEDGFDECAVLGPVQVEQLCASFPKIRILVESSRTRCFSDAEYLEAGATLVKRQPGGDFADLRGSRTPSPDVVLSTKQPYGRLIPGARQFAFYNVHRGQDHQLLRAMLAVDRHRHGTVVFTPFPYVAVDYELVLNDRGRRMLQFGSWAGRVGMLNTLAALGVLYPDSPFAGLKAAREYDSYGRALHVLAGVSARVHSHGITRPFVIGVIGHGDVSAGAQEVLDDMWGSGLYESLTPAELLLRVRAGALKNKIYKVVFSRQDRYVAAGQVMGPGHGFNAAHYESEPERYASRMAEYVMHLDALVNAVHWEPRYPRLLTDRDLYRIARTGQRLIIADITCDRRGSIPTPEITHDASRPFLLWNGIGGSMAGWTDLAPGTDLPAGYIPILANDRLPRDLARDASEAFAASFLPYLTAIARGGDDGELERQRAIVDAALAVGCTLNPKISAAIV